MKRLILVLALTPCFQLNGQIDSFDLKTIKNPKFKLNLLEFNVNLRQHSNSGISDNSGGTTTENYDDINGTFSTRYYSVLNSEQYQGNQNTQISVSGDRVSGQITNRDINRQSFIGRLQHTSQNRFYFFGDQLQHIVINPSASTSYSENKQSNNDVTNPWIFGGSSERRAQLNAEIGYGLGRVENVSDARIVLFILDDLRKEGLLNREPTLEEIDAISDLTIYVKNQRFFDSRIKRIYELKSIDSLLQSQGILKKDDVAYHTILQDNWNYSVNKFRQIGWLLQIGFKPSTFFRESESTADFKVGSNPHLSSNDKSESISNGIALFTKYNWFSPISQVLQNDISAGIEVLANNNRTNSTALQDGNLFNQLSNNSDNISYRINVRDNFGIYPTNRTYISLYGGASLALNSTLNNQLPLAPIQESINLNLQTGLETYYYFSPQLRLSCYYNVNYGSR